MSDYDCASGVEVEGARTEPIAGRRGHPGGMRWWDPGSSRSFHAGPMAAVARER
jgi:hypothetical protein